MPIAQTRINQTPRQRGPQRTRHIFRPVGGQIVPISLATFFICGCADWNSLIYGPPHAAGSPGPAQAPKPTDS
ncbi:hypothetical protein BH11PLA1_BH11PLA1_09440 [soil metagenome]